MERIHELESTPWYSRGGAMAKEALERSSVVLSVPTLQILLVPQVRYEYKYIYIFIYIYI